MHLQLHLHIANDKMAKGQSKLAGNSDESQMGCHGLFEKKQGCRLFEEVWKKHGQREVFALLT